MGRWKRCVVAAISMAVVIVPAGIARASTTGLIAFTSDRDHPLGGPAPAGYPLIYTMNADGTGAQRLTFNSTGISDESPDWSYDGTKIAFIRSSHVWVMNADGSNQTQLTTAAGADFHPSWSPDGTKIAYEHRTSAGSQIMVMNADGSNPQTLTTSPYDSETPSWSPDGTKIAFASDRAPPNFIFQIYVMGADGSNQTPVTSSTAPSGDTDPAWSPDGTKIAFLGDVVSGGTHSPHIFVMNANGTNPVQITNGAGSGEGAPTWSPDGTQIAFAASYPPMPDTFAPSQIYKVNSDGSGPVTDLSNNSNQEGSPAWQKNGVVDISAGQPVPEPATGSVPATFTITLPAAQASAVTVHYKTLDGTATAAANAYTAIADGSVTIPAGQTSAQIQVQVDNGSGQATTASEGFQVLLTSSSGNLAISSTAATGVITVPGITGKLTDDTGAVQPGHALTLTGTAASGQSVTQQLVTDGGGRYRLYADPGTYSLAPDPLGGKQTYEPVGCPGTVKPGACTQIALASDASLTIDFKLLTLVVNSTMDSADLDQAGLGLCDVTPTQAVQTCTLRQAIYVADQLGGGTITFDIPGGGVPVIQSSDYLPVTAPTVIDGTTQPGSHEVAVMGVGKTPGFDAIAQGVTLRGLTVDGFAGYDVALIGGDDTLQQDQLGTIGGSPDVYNGIVHDEQGAHNVIQGNTIGGPPLDPSKGDKLLWLESPGDTIGGGLPGQGNVIRNGPALITGAGDVIQGNTFTNATTHVGDNATVGGPTPVPGTGVGNDMSDRDGPGLVLESGDVVQGNHVHDSQSGIEVQNGAKNTIGGATPEMGNLIEHNGTGSNLVVARAGIGIGEPRVLGGSNNVIENNRIIDNAGDGGVAIYGGLGNQVINNEMSGNMLGINLGGGTFLYDNVSHAGPNDYQPYPQLTKIGAHGGLHVSGRLNGSPHRTYTIELYSQPSCAIDSVTPGEGLHYLGRRVLPTGAQFTLAFPAASPGQHAVTATATADDGSTSEFSPCLTIGHSARSFSKAGVTPTSSNVPITTTTKTARHAAAARKAAKTKTTAHGIVQLLCPPITTGSCTGTLVLATTGRRPVTLVRKHFKLAPGRGDTITFTLPASLLSRLERVHRIAAKATITAHDAAKHHHHKTTVTKLTLRLAHK